MLVDLMIVFLILMLVGSLPSWPYSRHWGYVGTGGIALLLLAVVALLLANVI